MFHSLLDQVGMVVSYLIFSGNSKDGRSFFMAKSIHFLHPATPQHPWPRVGLLRSRPDLIPQLFISRFLPDTVHDTRVM